MVLGLAGVDLGRPEGFMPVGQEGVEAGVVFLLFRNVDRCYFPWLAWVREMIFLGWHGSIGPCLMAVCDAALRCLRSLPLNHGDMRTG